MFLSNSFSSDGIGEEDDGTIIFFPQKWKPPVSLPVQYENIMRRRRKTIVSFLPSLLTSHLPVPNSFSPIIDPTTQETLHNIDPSLLPLPGSNRRHNNILATTHAPNYLTGQLTFLLFIKQTSIRQISFLEGEKTGKRRRSGHFAFSAQPKVKSTRRDMNSLGASVTLTHQFRPLRKMTESSSDK